MKASDLLPGLGLSCFWQVGCKYTYNSQWEEFTCDSSMRSVMLCGMTETRIEQRRHAVHGLAWGFEMTAGIFYPYKSKDEAERALAGEMYPVDAEKLEFDGWLPVVGPVHERRLEHSHFASWGFVVDDVFYSFGDDRLLAEHWAAKPLAQIVGHLTGVHVTETLIIPRVPKFGVGDAETHTYKSEEVTGEPAAEALCKGCYVLGTACGTCSRCTGERAELLERGAIGTNSHEAATLWGQRARGEAPATIFEPTDCIFGMTTAECVRKGHAELGTGCGKVVDMRPLPPSMPYKLEVGDGELSVVDRGQGQPSAGGDDFTSDAMRYIAPASPSAPRASESAIDFVCPKCHAAIGAPCLEPKPNGGYMFVSHVHEDRQYLVTWTQKKRIAADDHGKSCSYCGHPGGGPFNGHLVGCPRRDRPERALLTNHDRIELDELRGAAEQWDLDRTNLKAIFDAHTKAVGEFLSELYGIMVDPLADGSTKVAEMMTTLRDAALRQRENDRTMRDALTSIGSDSDPASLVAREALAQVQGQMNPKAPAHQFELRMTIGACTWEYAIRAAREIADMIGERKPENVGLASGSWDGSHSIDLKRREVTPDQFREELEAWRIAMHRGGE